LTSLPGIYSATYYYNVQDENHVACSTRRAPWSCKFNTYFSYGGPYTTLFVVARDVLNNVLATSSSVAVTVANSLPVPVSTFAWAISAPASPWSGTSNTITPSYSGTDAGSGSITCYIDGQQVGQTPNTTQFDNGSRLLRCDGSDTHSPISNWQAAQEWEQLVTFSNGSSAMELRMQPGYEIFLCTTAQTNCPTSIAVTGKVYNTDETSSAATFPSTPTISTPYTYSAGLPVTVSSCSSCTSVTITASFVGSAQVTFTESGGKTRTIWVHVNSSNILPHFGTDGSILTAYNPAKSFTPVSVFQSSNAFPQTATNGGGDGGFYPAAYNYGQDSVNSGVNTAEFGCQTNLSYTSVQSTFQAAQTNYVAGVTSLIPPVRYWNCAGDSMMRGTGQAFVTTRSPSASWSPPATQYTFQSLTGVGMIAVEMVDEVNSSWNVKPLQSGFTWGNPISTFSCVSGGNCTIACTPNAQDSLPLASGCTIAAGRFIVTGSGDSNLDYNSTSGATPSYVVNGGTNATNGGNTTITFATPAGVGTKTYTASANPNLTVQWEAWSTFDANGNGCPPQASSAGPCPNWNQNNMFQFFMSQANAATGHPSIGWPNAGLTNSAGVQDWMGDPNMSTHSTIYYANTWSGLYAPGALPVWNSKVDQVVNFRQKYGALATNRLAPILAQGIGTETYGFQGYSVGITSITGNLVTFSSPHGITNVIPYSTRLWISGNSSSTYNTNMYVMDCPTTTTCHVSFAKWQLTANYSGAAVTATTTFGATFPLTTLSATTGFSFGSARHSTACGYSNLRGFTFSVTGTGTALDGVPMWMIAAPAGQQGCTLGTWDGAVAQIPTGSGTGGTATIVANNGYTRGINYALVPSNNGPRFPFSELILQYLMGASGVRTYIGGSYIDDAQGQNYTRVFQDTSTLTYQAGTHPRYGQYGLNQLNWHANSMAALLAQRLVPCLFEPRGSGPDYGQFFEATVRLSSICNLLMVESFGETPLTRTIDLTPIVVSGQPTIKYCAGWAGITVTTVSTTADPNASFDPDNCAVAAYVATPNAANWLSPPVIAARLGDIPNASSIVIQWTYSPIQFSARQVNEQALYQTFNLSSGTGILPIDRRIGTVYYRLLYLASNSQVLATSDIQTF
jgi:hypothetical protein